ncbi:MAG TPA: hypothetical protein VD866_05500, partial [Urbifossiella sp.]|nr:hypothetical protein [Urbifossiella sp.]
MKTPTLSRPRLESLETRDTPTAFTVNTLADGGAGSGTTGDLRYCLSQANASIGPDTIDFSVTGLIPLGSALPAVTDDVTLTGPGAASLTVSGNDA